MLPLKALWSILELFIMLKLRIIFVTCILSAASSVAYSESATGTFTANNSCELYRSKSKQTNPDAAKSVIDKQYPLIEYLGDIDNPTWFRVKTTLQQSPDRWINASCGTADLKPIIPPSGGGSGSNTNSCHTALTFDSYLLALSWQPGFCKVNGRGKEECDALKQGNSGPTMTEFSLHGLWPNKTACGTKYNYCKGQSYDTDIQLAPAIKAKLKELMPSTQYNSKLENHEWDKHGTCQGGTPDQYFGLATSLVTQINTSYFVTNFIQPNIGKEVSIQQVNTAFEQAFGNDSSKYIALKCTSNQLVELDINLPKDIAPSQTIEDLLSQSSKTSSSSCQSSFLIGSAN